MGGGESKHNDKAKDTEVNSEDAINNQKTKYIPNYNKQFDSDYDDEVDSVAEDHELKRFNDGDDDEPRPLGLHDDKQQKNFDDENQGLLTKDAQLDEGSNENLPKSKSQSKDHLGPQSDSEDGHMVDDRPEIKKKALEVPRFIEDNNSRNALNDDLDNPSLLDVAYDKHGLLPFNYFMHLFLIITRHSKEWHIKEQRKQLVVRRRAWKVKDWPTYEGIV